MTTSGSTDFSVSTSNILRDAALLINVIDSESDLTPKESADAQRMLNMLVKQWQTKVELWPTKDVQHTLTPGTESYTVGTGGDITTARPLRLISCRREDSDGVEVEIEVTTRQEYKSLPQKSTQAPPNMVYYDPQLTNGVLYVWPTGDTSNKILNLTFQRPIEDFDAGANTPDLPAEWYLPLVYNLGMLLGPQFGVTVSQDIVAQARTYLEELEGWDTEEGSLFFEPGRVY